jgi:hypothetical protein
MNDSNPKGIDDLLAAGLQPRLLQGDVVWSAIAEILKEARDLNPTKLESELAQATLRLENLEVELKKDTGWLFQEENALALRRIRENDLETWVRYKTLLRKYGILRDLELRWAQLPSDDADPI